MGVALKPMKEWFVICIKLQGTGSYYCTKNPMELTHIKRVETLQCVNKISLVCRCNIQGMATY